MVIDGAVNRDAFLVYLEKVLGPTLKPGDLGIVDNLPAHKGERVCTLVERRGAKLRFMPPTHRS